MRCDLAELHHFGVHQVCGFQAGASKLVKRPIGLMPMEAYIKTNLLPDRVVETRDPHTVKPQVRFLLQHPFYHPDVG